MQDNYTHDGVKSIDFDEIKRTYPLAEYCESRRIYLKRQGGNRVGLCPLHQEDTPSFSVYDDNHFHCFGCGEHGDVIDLDIKLHGGTFKDALERLGGSPADSWCPPGAFTIGEQKEFEDTRLHKTAASTGAIPFAKYRNAQPAQARAVEPEQPSGLTQEQREQCHQASKRLLANIDEIASWRGWKPETIEALAKSGHLGLWDNGRPAFIYETGAKVRTWKTGKDKKNDMSWPFGKGSLWRGHLITSDVQRIILAEGEVDAITLVDCGVEADGTIVTAISGASNSLDKYRSLFQGKVVELAYDLDDAGKKATRKAIRALRGVASEVHLMDLSLDDADREIKDVTDLWQARQGLTVKDIERRFFRVDDIAARIEKWLVAKFGDDVLVADEKQTGGDDKTYWAEIEGRAAASLRNQIGEIRCVADDWYVQVAGIWRPTDRNLYRPLAFKEA